jgi:hypothetical protein
MPRPSLMRHLALQDEGDHLKTPAQHANLYFYRPEPLAHSPANALNSSSCPRAGVHLRKDVVPWKLLSEGCYDVACSQGRDPH